MNFVARLNASGETKLAGKWITFVKLRQPDQWLVQHDDGWLSQLVSVHRVEAGSVRTLSVVAIPTGDVLDPCRVAVHICQVSGTCYFNAAVNQCCLGTRMARLTLKAVRAQVALCTEAERRTFFEDALDLSACPAQFTRLDVLRLLYALVSPLSPTKLAADLVGTKPQYNVTAEAIYALGFRRRASGDPGDQEVGHEGGDTAAALQALFGQLGIGWYGLSGQSQDPDVVALPVTSNRRTTVRVKGSPYDLQSCAILLIFSRTEQHAVTGFFCGKRPYICDSSVGVVVPFDWPSWTGKYKPKAMAEAFREQFNYHARQTPGQLTLDPKLVEIEYGLYVRRAAAEAPPAKKPRLT